MGAGVVEVILVGTWRKLHHEELLNIHFSSRPIRGIKSRTMKRIGHIARIEDQLRDLDIDGRIGLLFKLVLEVWNVIILTRLL
jgi:hypothetical protein